MRGKRIWYTTSASSACIVLFCCFSSMAQPNKAPLLGDTPTVFAAWFCPFAQRTLIALYAKKPPAAFTIHEISHDDLYNKPSWFTDLNPAGLIPVIAWKPANGSNSTLSTASAAACALEGVVSVKESLICNEYLEDAYPEPPLLPPDPVGRASARLMIQRFSDKFVPAFYKLLVLQDEPCQAAAAAILTTELAWLVEHMSPSGPYALSDHLSLVDCAIAPFLLRLFILEHYRGYTGHKQGAVTQRLEHYMTAAQQHPAIAATMYHPEGLIYTEELLNSYARYADGSANSLMAREAKSKK